VVEEVTKRYCQKIDEKEKSPSPPVVKGENTPSFIKGRWARP